jgi:hypothetical protein
METNTLQPTTTFQPLPVSGLKGDELRSRMRLNSLGSLYYFVSVGLKRKRLVPHLHAPICNSLERDHIKDVYELPRDHFKSTICSEGLPIWRVLPVTDNDKNSFVKLGYSTEFIEWLSRVHRPAARNLLISENITNAAKLGRRIAWHYESNSIFRLLFPEILPSSKETWSNFSLHHRIPPSCLGSRGHGEGTFDFLGVGGALQSRHYDGMIVEDDLIGRKAVESSSIMEKTIEYHQLLAGAFENESNIFENDELVVGNRWAYTDLNSYIKEHEPWFNFSTHSALGGCCSLHIPDAPLFPEEFSFEKLLKIRDRLGNYLFSCQFLNNPAAPENADFKESDLRHFEMEWSEKECTYIIKHEVRDGVIKKDVRTSHLNICLVTDPNHSGNSGFGRCRHCVLVVGLSSIGDYYLLDCWAEGCNFDKYYAKIFELADKWKLHKIGVETVAAQRYIAHHINYVNRLEGRSMRIVELRGEVEAPDGGLSKKKEFRIRTVLSPILEGHHLYAKRNQMDFLGELTTFPKGKFKDILDSLAYCPQMLKLPASYLEEVKWRAANAAGARRVNQPYSVMVH